MQSGPAHALCRGRSFFSELTRFTISPQSSAELAKNSRLSRFLRDQDPVIAGSIGLPSAPRHLRASQWQEHAAARAAIARFEANTCVFDPD
jgi:hypothetical protein